MARLLQAGEKLRHLSNQHVGPLELLQAGLGIIKSNDKTCLNKNPSLKKCPQGVVGEAPWGTGRGSEASSQDEEAGALSPGGVSARTGARWIERGRQLWETSLGGGVREEGRPPRRPPSSPYHPRLQLSTRGAAGSPLWSRRSG